MITARANFQDPDLVRLYVQETAVAQALVNKAREYERNGNLKRAHGFYVRLIGFAMTAEQDWLGRSKSEELRQKLGLKRKGHEK